MSVVPELPRVRYVPVDELAGAVPRLLPGLGKVVALVGYQDDPEASAIARLLPYGIDGDGIEEIVFVRVGEATGEIVQFDDDAWPGEDRTYVQDDLDAAIDLVLEHAAERGLDAAGVLVTGRPQFVRDVADKLGEC